jgi:ribonuclease G
VKKELIIRSNSDTVDFAMLNDGKLVELNKEIGKNKFSVGDIYVAKIRKIIPGLNAAFVDVNNEKDGFLHYHDLGPKLLSLTKFAKLVESKKIKSFSFNDFKYEKDISKNGLIKDSLSPKQTVLVQVIKEPISTKGPRLSSEISLAGRFMVIVPFSERISISQKIKNTEERKRLKNLVSSIKPKGFGVIIRTVAKNRKVAELEADLKDLIIRWKRLCINFSKADTYPAKILGEINRSSSILRDIFDDSFTGIYISDSDLYSEIKEYIKNIAPKKTSIVKLYSSTTPIFDKFGIERQIKSSFGRTVSMQKGAYLIIEHTEALHVIDVNSGKRSNKSKTQEETAMEVNLIASAEIARQLRLRDMGGIIVVDFIDLTSGENRKKLFEHFCKEMDKDRTKHKILPPSKFGLIQITRQRVRPQMSINTREPNPNKNLEVEAPILLIDKINIELNEIVKNSRYKKEKIYLHVHPFVAAYINSGFLSIKNKWYLKYKRSITIIARDSYLYLEYHFFNNDSKLIK